MHYITSSPHAYKLPTVAAETTPEKSATLVQTMRRYALD